MDEQKKAYDLKDLGDKIIAHAKADGLEIAEEAVEKLAKAAYFGVKDWAKESAAISETKIDDLAAKFYDYADQFVVPQIEAIDIDHDGD